MSENEAADDAGLAISRKTVKATVAGGWQDKTTDRDTLPSSWDEARLANIAAKMRQSSIHETALSDRVIGQARAAARGSQFIDYGFGVLYALLATRGVLALIAASSTNGFVRLITEVTDPFYAPFRGIVPSPSVDSGHTLVVPLLIAIAVYALLHMGIRGLLRLFGTRKTRI